MEEWIVALLAAGMLLAAFGYAAVGHGGASAYIAAMALAGIAPAEMRPIALLLNILVSSLGTWKFYRAGFFRWRLFWPFAVVSIPMAYLGGAITLPGHAYKILVGVVLLYAAWQLWRSGRTRRGNARGARAAARLGDGDRRGEWALLAGPDRRGRRHLSSARCCSMLGWAGTKQTSAVAAPFILVNSLAGLAAVFIAKSASAAGLCRRSSRRRSWSAAGSVRSTAAGASPIPLVRR